ncbi:MAG: hypothetical protein PHO30_01730 [Candidatus Omnitrophica bacterium]|nr:hypothetical protein [Candidatus Omnitrophota bacterium]
MPDSNCHSNHKKPFEKHDHPDFCVAKKKRSNHKALELTIYENSMASRVTKNDIIRACALYHQTQKKIIKSKITQIFLN